MMLCCLHDGFNGTVGLSLSQVFLESISEDGQLAIGLEATECFLGLQQAGGGPSERHLGVSPAFDVAGDLAHRAERVLYDVGAGERAPEFVRQAEADDGEDLVPFVLSATPCCSLDQDGNRIIGGRLQSIADGGGFKLVDLFGDFVEKIQETGRSYLYFDFLGRNGGHWNALGHRVAGTRLANAICGFVFPPTNG